MSGTQYSLNNVQPQGTNNQEKGSNTGLIVGLMIFAILVIGVIIYLSSVNKNNTNESVESESVESESVESESVESESVESERVDSESVDSESADSDEDSDEDVDSESVDSDEDVDSESADSDEDVDSESVDSDEDSDSVVNENVTRDSIVSSILNNYDINKISTFYNENTNVNFKITTDFNYLRNTNYTTEYDIIKNNNSYQYSIEIKQDTTRGGLFTNYFLVAPKTGDYKLFLDLYGKHEVPRDTVKDISYQNLYIYHYDQAYNVKNKYPVYDESNISHFFLRDVYPKDSDTYYNMRKGDFLKLLFNHTNAGVNGNKVFLETGLQQRIMLMNKNRYRRSLKSKLKHDYFKHTYVGTNNFSINHSENRDFYDKLLPAIRSDNLIE